jgi:hypothetical protein
MNISVKESPGYHDLKRHKPLFDKEYSKFLDQRKEAKLQWLQDQSEINVGNLNNIRCQASRNFRNKKREYLKDKIDELAMYNKNKNSEICIEE